VESKVEEDVGEVEKQLRFEKRGVYESIVGSHLGKGKLDQDVK